MDAARSRAGMVLIAPGVYHEAVTVTTPYVTIRGMDRNRTIIDGEFERAIGIHVIEADGVTIENLTSRNHLSERVPVDERARVLRLVPHRATTTGTTGSSPTTRTGGSSTIRTRAARPIRASTSASATPVTP